MILIFGFSCTCDVRSKISVCGVQKPLPDLLVISSINFLIHPKRVCVCMCVFKCMK